MYFDFAQDYILENKKLLLEPLEMKHFKALKQLSEEKNIWTYFLGKSNGEGCFKEYVTHAIEQRNLKKEYPFAVFDKINKRYVGSTRFFEFEKQIASVRLGYTWYGKEARGTFVNKNCKYLLLEFAFDFLKVARVGLGAHAENIISIAAMKSIGCKEEGIRKNFFPAIDGSGQADAVLLSVSKQEWKHTVNTNLKKRL